jgi:hypothetical protein
VTQAIEPHRDGSKTVKWRGVSREPHHGIGGQRDGMIRPDNDDRQRRPNVFDEGVLRLARRGIRGGNQCGGESS